MRALSFLPFLKNLQYTVCNLMSCNHIAAMNVELRAGENLSLSCCNHRETEKDSSWANCINIELSLHLEQKKKTNTVSHMNVMRKDILYRSSIIEKEI